MHWNSDKRLPLKHHYQESGSIFSMHFSYAARLTRFLHHPHLLFSSWKKTLLPDLIAPVLQPSDCPVASMGLVPTSSCLQEPRTGHSVSAVVSEALNREIALLAPAQPWSSNGAQHVGGHLHLHMSLRAPDQLLQSCFTSLCPGSTTASTEFSSHCWT